MVKSLLRGFPRGLKRRNAMKEGFNVESGSNLKAGELQYGRTLYSGVPDGSGGRGCCFPLFLIA